MRPFSSFSCSFLRHLPAVLALNFIATTVQPSLFLVHGGAEVALVNGGAEVVYSRAFQSFFTFFCKLATITISLEIEARTLTLVG